MKKRGILAATLLLSGVLILGGCSSQSQSSSKTSHQNTTKTVKHSGKSTSKQTAAAKKTATLWNPKKDDQLKSFIDQWAPTMKQTYVKYDGTHSIKTPTDISYPDYLPKVNVEGTKDSIGWSKSGKGNYKYNVVAIYNYDNTKPPMEGHITYFFAFEDGQPVVLVDQSTNGTPNLTQTENTKLKTAFAQIADGNYQASSTTDTNTATTKSASKDTTQAVTDPKIIGILVREAARPSEDMSAENDMLGVYSANGKYWIGTGTSSSNVGYTIDGDTVHYFTKDYSQGDSTATAPLINHPVSLKDLQDKYYSTSDQQQMVQNLANKMPAIEDQSDD